VRGPRRVSCSGRGALSAVIFVLAAAVVTTLAVRFLGPRLQHEAALPVLGQVPAFEHIDENGKPFGARQLEGKVWVASFLYTTCPGPCPILVRKLQRFGDRFANRRDFHMVSFSVDPATDTPKVLRAYTEAHGIDTQRWSLLTGSPDAVIATIRKGFYLDASPSAQAARKPGLEAASPQLDPLHGPVIHSLRVVLVDRKGRIRGFYDSNDPAALVDLAGAVSRLLDAEPRADRP